MSPTTSRGTCIPANVGGKNMWLVVLYRILWHEASKLEPRSHHKTPIAMSIPSLQSALPSPLLPSAPRFTPHCVSLQRTSRLRGGMRPTPQQKQLTNNRKQEYKSKDTHRAHIMHNKSAENQLQHAKHSFRTHRHPAGRRAPHTAKSVYAKSV